MSGYGYMLDVRVTPGAQQQLRAAYAALAERVRAQPGLISHALCQSVEDGERWLVIAEWESLEASDSWDQSDDHARLIAPMRACFASASRTRFDVRDGLAPAGDSWSRSEYDDTESGHR